MLEPDLLAEVLVTRVLLATDGLLDAALDQALDRDDPVATAQLTRALVVTSRAAGRSTALRDLLGASLDERLPRLVARVAETEAELVAAVGLAVDAAWPVRGAVNAQPGAEVLGPRTGALALQLGTLAVTGLRLAIDGQQDPSPELQAAYAVAAMSLSSDYGIMGRSSDGLDPMGEAVATYRTLAQADPARFLPDLATSLTNQGELLRRAGRPTEGLEPIAEAITIRRTLARAEPDRFLASLANSLNNQANLLAGSGRFTEGLAAINEAVTIRRDLARTAPGRFLPDLAMSLNNQSNMLAETGRPADGLAPIAEAIALRRILAEADPARFLADLAGSLSNQCSTFAQAGRPSDGLASMEEAVTTYRALAQADPTRFLPDLAMALNNQSNLLAETGRPSDGLEPIAEAVTIRRELADVDPIRFLPDLAMSLNNQSNRLAQAERAADALTVIDEAVAINRALAQADPTRFLPDLARTLTNQANRLAETGRRTDALTVIDEAVTTNRPLAQADPVRFRPDLAMALINQANRLAEAGRAADGLVVLDEAVDVYRDLAGTDPTRFRPDLAMSLNNRATLLSRTGRPGDGLAAIDEAVDIYRDLAGIDPARFRPDLAMSLNNRCGLLADLGRPADGLAPVAEAVRIRRDLARDDPIQFLPDLALSLSNEADRLTEVGRADEATHGFELVLAEYAEPGWPRGVLLLARGQLRVRNGDAPGGAADTVEAMRLLDAAGDRRRRSEARRLLRQLRVDDEGTIDAAWGEHEALPPWLGHADIDAAAEEILIAWMTTDDWQATFTHLAEHAATILSDRGEASLEHLIDNNPFNGTLDQHLVILQTARVHGVDAVRDQFLADLAADALTREIEEWIATPTWTASAEHLTAHADRLLTDDADDVLADLVVEQPDRLTYLALLQLSRDLGVDEAHALVTDPPALAEAIAAATTPEARWPLVRLAAGLEPGDAENHLAHALTAAELGGLDEASWAMERCRDTLASWQRPGVARRLEEFAAAHPDLDVAPLREALQAG